ncbi:hypothetical protein ABHA37_08255 [Clostridium tertium]|uniref:hypothetical protein n=1 Tax=Clostridium tertium TaxID=1559 RepID=UPI00232EE7F3|nr:hypothetical protein [Clostridium tertium]MDB1923405.1 hypothetical protein [Clostridium tertium]MDB1930010.1 hypothetical protein [Clostridium tertium]
MKLYRRINNEGYFIEDILLEEIPYYYDEELNKIYDTNYIENPVREGFYKPKWNGTEWMEGMTLEEIEAIKNTPVEQPLELKNRADIDYMSLMLGVEL